MRLNYHCLVSLHYLGGRLGGIATVNGLNHTRSQLLEGHARHIVHAHNRLAIITALADARNKGYLAQ